MALLSCKWCAFSQKRVQDLFEHLGPSCYDDFSEVTREEFSTAFVEYVKWLIKTCQASPDNFYDARSSSSSITGSFSMQQPRPPKVSPLCSGVAAARFLAAAKKGSADGPNQAYSNNEINLEAHQKLAGANQSRRGCRHKMMSSSPQRQQILLSRQQPAPSRSSDRKRSLRLGSPLDAESGGVRVVSAEAHPRRASTAATGELAGSIPSTPMAVSRRHHRRPCPKAIGGGSRGTSSDGAPALHCQSVLMAAENVTADDGIIRLMHRRRHSETDTACLEVERKRGLPPSAGSRPLLPSSSLHSRQGAWQSFTTLGTGASSSPMKPVTKDNPWSGINLPSGKSSSAARRPKLSPKSSRQSSDCNNHLVAHQDIRPAKGAAMVQQHVTREQMRAFKGMPVEVDGTVRIQEFEKHLGKRAPRLVERAKKHYEASARRCSRKPAVVRGLDLDKLLPRLFPDASKAEIKAIIDIVIRPVSSKFPCSDSPKKTTETPKSDPLVAEALAVFQYLTKSQKEQCLAYEQCVQGLQMTGMGSEELECSLEELFCENEDGTIWKETICLEEFTRWFTS